MQNPSISPSTLRSADTNQKAYLDYENKDYAAALATLTSLLKQNASDMEVRFYTAICQLRLGKVEEAIDNFKTIIADNNNIFIREAQWFLALAYIKNGQIEKAQENLNLIQKETHPRAKNVEALLNKLKAISTLTILNE